MQLDYIFIGWCRDEINNHDKIWGVIKLSGEPSNFFQGYRCLLFWGRRSKKLQTKIAKYDSWELTKLILNKKNKGYQTIDKNHLDKVYPQLETDLEKTVVWATLLA